MGVEQEKPLVLIDIDETGLCAKLSLADPTARDLPTPESIINELETARLRIDDDLRLDVAQFVDRLKTPAGRGETFVIATGEAPTEPEDGRVEFAAVVNSTDGACTRFQNIVQHSALIVQRNAVIGRIISPTPARAGMNVFGDAVPPLRPHGEPVRLSKSVKLCDDGVSLVATRPGRCAFTGGVISVNELTLIQRDIRPSVEKLDWINDVIIQGDVRDAANLHSSESIVVIGAVKDAAARAAHSVIVHFGLIGTGKGRIQAGGDVAAKFCEDAGVQAGRDVVIGSSAVNSTLTAGRDVVGENASIVGGCVTAGRSIRARQVGSELAVATKIVVTENYRTPIRAAATQDMVGAKTPKLRRVEDYRIDVSEMIHSGVAIEIGGRRARFNDDVQGPLVIRSRVINGECSLLATRTTDGGEWIIPSESTDPAASGSKTEPELSTAAK